METPRPSDDVPTEDFEALNKLLVSNFPFTLEDFLASHPVLFKALSSRSCPLQTQFYLLCMFTRQTDDLLDEIYRIRFKYEAAVGQDRKNAYSMHTVCSWGAIHLGKLILIYESGSSSVCLQKDMDGNTPLHNAAGSSLAGTNQVRVINMLLENCWECAGMRSDKKNETSLHCALKNNRVEAFRTLLEWYIITEEFSNNNARDWECGDTTLDLLIDGYEKIVKQLLCQSESKVCFKREFWEGKYYFVVIKCKNKGSIKTSFEGRDYIREVTSKTTSRTILSLSVDSRSIITLKVLIRSVMVRGILDEKDVDGNTVFDLLEEGTNLNLMGFVPYERYENVIWLLDAIQMGDYEAFSKLQVEDPQILNYVCELPLGGTPLHIAVTFGQLNNCTREIIKKRPEFAVIKDRYGYIPLHIASKEGYLEIVQELLIKVGYNQCYVSTLDADEDEDEDMGEFHGTPLYYAIKEGRISVINELLSVWWRSTGEIRRERDTILLETAVENRQFEALKTLMERYIEDELLKAKEVDGNPMSALADGYIEIVKHLLSPKVNYSLSILVKNRYNEKKKGSKLHSPLYFAVIKATNSSRMKGHKMLDQIPLSAYYPKYFREVTIQNNMVLLLSKDDENSVTLKLLLKSPLFHDVIFNKTVFEELRDKLKNEVVENEMGTLIPIWSYEKSVVSRSSSIDVYDDAMEQLGERPNNSHDGAEADGNEQQLSVAAKKDYGNVLENLKDDHRNDSAEDDNKDISIADRQDGYTMRNQDGISLKEKQEFASFEECRDAIKDAAVSGKFEVKFTRLGRPRIVAECSNASCKWKIRAKPRGSIYAVTKIENDHTCLPEETATLPSKFVKPKWVSSHIIGKVRQDRTISTQEIISFIKSEYKVDITCETAQRAKKRALETVYGTGQTENRIQGSQKYKKIRSNLGFLLQFPKAVHEHIHSTEDVEKDGHCGYRVVAMQLGYKVMNGWKQVRRELLTEVVQNEELYVKLMDLDKVAKMRKAFVYSEDRATDRQHWLSLPDAGYVIANAYKAVVVSLSVRSGNFTFLPLVEPPPEGRTHRIITLCFVDGNHFISVSLKPDAPIPRVDRRWVANVSKAAEVWKTPYLDRFDKFEEIMGLGQRGNTASASRPIIMI